MIASEGEPQPGQLVAAARDRRGRARRSPPRRPAHDRRPARGDRPADAAVVPPRPQRRRRRSCSPLASRCCSTRSTSPTSADALERAHALAERCLRRRPRLAALDALARAAGRGFRPAVPLRARAARRSPSLTVRHHPASTVAALLLAGWLASRLDWRAAAAAWPHGDALRGGARAERQDVALRLAGRARACSCAASRASTLETASGRSAAPQPRPGRAARAQARRSGATEREWTIPGASRGETRRARRGHPPGAAARPHLRCPARAGAAARAAAVTRLTTCPDAESRRAARGRT